ncbi:MAG: hydroxyacid dehydrogenase [Acidobacteria bacterium]|nr:MAG: hydroxyacid dehydrogenase [Acidobacteriota bacterium]
MTRVVSSAPMPPQFFEGTLGAAGIEDLEVTVPSERTQTAFVDAVAGADLVVGDYTFELEIDRAVIDAMEGCRLIQQPSAGYQHIDIEYAASKGIPVANSGGANDIAVAEHTVMSGLALIKHLREADKATREGSWPQLEIGGVELAGRTWGIVGFGRIGREVARRLSGFGCTVLFSDPFPPSEDVQSELGVSEVDLDALLKKSDVVSLHCPLTDETRNLIDSQALAKIGSAGFLINVARGEVIVEDDLVEALRSGKLGGAAVDVFTEEPPDSGHPLFGLENVILSPHIAGVTAESRRRIMAATVENLARAAKGEEPLNVVNGVVSD